MPRSSFAAVISAAVTAAMIGAATPAPGRTVEARAAAAPTMDLAQFISSVRAKAAALENSDAMRRSFAAFAARYQVAPRRISQEDYVLVRVLYEATRDAGFWNLRWSITNREPNSDHIWRQWREARPPSPWLPTAIAECDELSALYAFLAGRAGIRGVGLFWPTRNHTVAVWKLRPVGGTEVRVVVPTSQIFLGPADTLGTRAFDPWSQKAIYDYTRRDVPESFALPRPLADFFLLQVDKYAAASDATLQQLRYLRESVFLRQRSAEEAAREALRPAGGRRDGSREDQAAFATFAADMQRAGRP